MPTVGNPLKMEDLKFFSTSILATATNVHNVVAMDKPDPAKLAKDLNRLKIFIGLATAEVKELRKQK